MGILRALGVGSQKIAAQGNRTVGVVTSAETCWMIKVNKSAFRVHPKGALVHFDHPAGLRRGHDPHRPVALGGDLLAPHPQRP